jgi:hypothetical protein
MDVIQEEQRNFCDHADSHEKDRNLQQSLPPIARTLTQHKFKYTDVGVSPGIDFHFKLTEIDLINVAWYAGFAQVLIYSC